VGAAFTQENDYESEMATLALMVKSMLDFSRRINYAENIEEVTVATNRLAGNLETLGPLMKALTAKHPDWDTDLPEEVREPMSRYLDTLLVYQEAMQSLVAYVEDNPENKELQLAFGKLKEQLIRMNN
jgi:hypothetical protein